jgi:hypothetical protein
MIGFLSEAHVIALTLTLLVESAGIAGLFALRGSSRAQIKRCVLVCLGANLVTHTAFWIAFPWVPFEAAQRLCAFEVVIVAAEGAAYHRLCRLPWPSSMTISTVLNLMSFWLGSALWYLLY